jgi:putative two-component system response regulator
MDVGAPASFLDARIVVIDDERANVMLLEGLLELWGYRDVVGINRSADALDHCRRTDPDLILLDLHMPGIDGFGVLSSLSEHAWEGAPPPVLVLTADVMNDTRIRALALGASDFVGKPFDVTEVQLRVRNLLEMRRLHLELELQNHALSHRVSERTRDLEQARSEVLERLALAAEYRDDDTQEHARRIGRTCGLLAERLGLPAEMCELIVRAAPLHDVGKIGVPDAILLKPGRLTDDEREVMKQHTRIGAELLAGGHSPVLQLAREIALSHHERWDGSGYPDGVAAEAIPLAGRIVSVADVFDALIHERPYKRAWPIGEAVLEILDQRGHHFDPSVIAAFETLDHAVLGDRIDEPAVCGHR